MLCVMSPPMIARYFSVVGDSAQQSSFSLHKTAITELKILSFVRLIKAAEYATINELCFAHARALTEDKRFCANKGVLIPLKCKIRGNILRNEYYPLLAFVH